MRNPLVSVIVPVYKVQKYLHRCVDSILAQTYTNLEIILVDDGSPDACGQICDAYAARDSRIRVVHKENGGVGSARNSGMEICTGDYIMFVDSDDYLDPEAVQALFDRMVADGSDMAVGKHTDVDEEGSVNGAFCSWMKDVVVSGRDIFATMGEKYFVPVAVWGKLYKKELLEGITFPSWKCGEDLWVYLQIVDRCKSVSIVDKTIYFYYLRANSVIHEKSESVKHDELEATLYTVRFLWQRGFQSSARRWYARGISKAICFADKKIAIDLFKQYFNRRERRNLLKGSSVKEYAKWISLFTPFVNEVYRHAKQMVKRG